MQAGLVVVGEDEAGAAGAGESMGDCGADAWGC